MKKVLLTSAKISFVFLLVWGFSVCIAYGQDTRKEAEKSSNIIPKIKQPADSGKSSKTVGSIDNASVLKPALAPAKASDTISPSLTTGEISPAKASDTISPALNAGSPGLQRPPMQ